jgi:hypothetical protein
MIIYGRIPEKNRPSSVTCLMIIYGHLWASPKLAARKMVRYAQAQVGLKSL